MPFGRCGAMAKSGRRASTGSTGTSVASGTWDPGAASSDTRCPASASPRARQTTMRWVPP